MNILQTVKSIFVLFILSVLISCSATDGNNTTGASAETGRVTLLITDGVTEDFDEVNLTVESISFIGEDDGHETIVFDESRVINLLALQHYSDWLVTAVIPAGTYDKIRMHVTKVELVKEGQDPIITKLPANGKVDLNPRGTFDVDPDGDLIIQLDVDAEKSIHIIKKGNGEYSYNFRPVVFVKIMGVDDDSKLVLLDGKVLARTEADFKLCDVQDLEVNDNCLTILISQVTVAQDDQPQITVVQTDQINVVLPGDEGYVEDEDIVTVLGIANKNIEALHIVIAAKDKEVSDLALFKGKATSDATDDKFSMKTIVQPIDVSLVDGSGVRVFDKYGKNVGAGEIAVDSGVVVFGLVQPVSIDGVADVKAAFVIIDNDIKRDKVSGTIAAINKDESQITVTVDSDTFTGDVCVDVNEAILFILGVDEGKVVSKEITINELKVDMLIDVYGQDSGLTCSVAAGVVLVAEPLAVTPSTALLVTGY